MPVALQLRLLKCGNHYRPRQARRAYVSVQCSSTQLGLTAVVIGSGFAGLSVAAGLSQRLTHVVLLERDSSPCKQNIHAADGGIMSYEVGIVNRQGVSQYRQPHVMLKKGLDLLIDLFPDYTARLSKAGAVKIDLLHDVIAIDFDREFQTDKPSDLHSFAASRHLFESVLRTCVDEVENISVQTGAVVSGLDFHETCGRVTGVRLKGGRQLHADLVIDASGSSSKVVEWLEQIGHTPPPTMTVDAGYRYTYRMYEMPEDPDRNWALAAINTNPDPIKAGLLIPIEGKKCQVNLAGYKGHHCPTDDAGYLEFARSLPSPLIYNTLRAAKPLTPVVTYAKTHNFRRLFEKAPPPPGLCVIGDAACCFNPIRGQGMTVGVMGGHLVCKCIDKQLAGVKPDSKEQQLAALDFLPAAFHQELGRMLEFPWAVATGPDAKRPDAFVDMPEGHGSALLNFLSGYVLTLQEEALQDHYLMTKLAAVGHMVAPPTSLFMPDVVIRLAWRLLGSRLSRLRSRVNDDSARVSDSIINT